VKHRRRSTQPRQGEVLLDGLFRRLGLADQARRYRALAAFHQAAGPRIAAKARGCRIAGSTLHVAVQSAAWAHELSFLHGELLERLRATPGGEWITEIRFEHRPLEEAPAWDEPGATPPPPPPAKSVARAVEDPDVAAALREVQDPELRAALTDLLARAAGAGEPGPGV
jgi:hypothetical protein